MARCATTVFLRSPNPWCQCGVHLTKTHAKKKLVKCYIWSVALFGAETWTFRKVDQKYLESSVM